MASKKIEECLTLFQKEFVFLSMSRVVVNISADPGSKGKRVRGERF